ncbi:hypothetical protein BKI52_40870 [marine bacterium AO1-C]|nr:hypothetical protein BKI52_40870 [marine bacterium AO1-C]
MTTKLLLNLALIFLSVQAYAQVPQKVALVKSCIFSSFSFKYTHTTFAYNQQGDVTSTIMSNYVINKDGKKDTLGPYIIEKHTYYKDSITNKYHHDPRYPNPRGIVFIETPEPHIFRGMKHTFFLNPQKLIQKIRSWISYRYLKQRRYDKVGHLVYEETINLSPSQSVSKTFYKYHQGNLVQSTTFYYDNTQQNIPKDTLIVNNEYYLDKLNTLGNANYGKRFYGKSSKNLLKSSQVKGDAKITYLYTFDKKGRVIEMIEKDKPQGITSYTYYD